MVHLDLSEAEWLGLNRGAELDPAVALLRRIRGALSRGLGDLSGAIEVHRVSAAPVGFDARFSALWRRYSYRIADGPALWDPLGRASTLWHKVPLDVGLLNEGAAPLLGLQDFRSYCKPREGATTIRELQRFEFERGADGVIVVTVQADAFCHNMVRSLVGSALYVGEGEEAPEWLYERLLARQRDARSVLAAPHPLVLEEGLRKNRVKTCSASVAVIPNPSSSTCSSTRSPSVLAETRTLPPLREYLMALEMRLSSAWLIRSGSTCAHSGAGTSIESVTWEAWAWA
ncbi:tRNA pseudouridine synthase A [Microbacterium sp. Bi128]|nr:tRNA pseudouridine synthase A [Microbacterium sp. Bi128]